MYYTVYKITNTVNNKIYIGTHITSNLNDSYMGSGWVLTKAIKKYGIESFIKEILHIFDNANDMFDKEAELVNEDFINSKDTYNIKLGGKGGWDYVNRNKLSGAQNAPYEQKLIWRQKGLEAFKEFWNKVFSGEIPDPITDRATFKGRTHSEETKQKMRNSHKKNGDQLGSKNSQYGTCWITKHGQNLKIKKEKLDEYLNQGYTKGRKIKYTESGQDGNAADC